MLVTATSSMPAHTSGRVSIVNRSSSSRWSSARISSSPTVEIQARMRAGGSSPLFSTSTGWLRALVNSRAYSSDTYCESEYDVSISVEVFQTFSNCRVLSEHRLRLFGRGGENALLPLGIGHQGLERGREAAAGAAILDDVVDQEFRHHFVGQARCSSPARSMRFAPAPAPALSGGGSVMRLSSISGDSCAAAPAMLFNTASSSSGLRSAA